MVLGARWQLNLILSGAIIHHPLLAAVVLPVEHHIPLPGAQVFVAQARGGEGFGPVDFRGVGEGFAQFVDRTHAVDMAAEFGNRIGIGVGLWIGRPDERFATIDVAAQETLPRLFQGPGQADLSAGHVQLSGQVLGWHTGVIHPL